MDRFNEFVANLPAPLRHGIAAFLGVFLLTVGTAIYVNGGVFSLDWASVLMSSFDEGVLGALATVGVLGGTNLTDAYGKGKALPTAEQHAATSGDLPAPLPVEVASVEEVVDDTVAGLPEDTETLEHE